MFKDHFSSIAAGYARHRPEYPAPLFTDLAARAPARDLAWDCATGSGQAARGLAPHFTAVVATDASAAQIAAARAPANVRFAVAPAQRCDAESGSVDLVTVAQALHWLDRASFYAEARRVLRHGGIIAAWCYALLRVSGPVDAVLDRLYRDVLGGCWPPERRHVDAGYRDIDFPFRELHLGAFQMRARWNLEQLLGYLATWSAVAACQDQHGGSQLNETRHALAAAWGPAARRRTVRWPLALRVGRYP